MRLAEDEISIRIGDECVHLRPTLRAASRLERRHCGFDKLLAAIADGNLSVVADVIRESSDIGSDIPNIIERMSAMPLRIGFEHLTEPLLRHVCRLAGIDPDAPTSEQSDTSERITFAEHHSRLFRIATGWLGWAPETAWNATAAEILAAYEGRTEMLRAIFGGNSDETSSGVPPAHTEDEINTGVAWLKLQTATGGNKAV